MRSAFDVFARDLSGRPIWLAATESLDEANQYVNRLAENSPGPYFVYSLEKGIVKQTDDDWADVT